jgi:hypothetical protein
LLLFHKEVSASVELLVPHNISGSTSLLDLRRDGRAYMQDALVALVALRS